MNMLVARGLGESRIAAKQLETTCGPRVSDQSSGMGTRHLGWWAWPLMIAGLAQAVTSKGNGVGGSKNNEYAASERLLAVCDAREEEGKRLASFATSSSRTKTRFCAPLVPRSRAEASLCSRRGGSEGS